MANEQLDKLDRIVESAGRVAILIGVVYFVAKVVSPYFIALIPV